MDLVHQVAANLEIEAGKAEKGIGAILMALRMNLDGETFKKVKHVLPNSESLMGRALPPPPTRHRPAPAPQILSQRPQADRPPARVDTSRVLERQGAQASLLIPIELGSIALRPALKRTDPVLEHGDLERRDLTLAHPALQQGQAPAHERRV